jgi:hypothetical protein
MTSTIKVDNIQNQSGANIINESSNTITIGASGDTVSLASGASQTGFGRTGTVDWQTGSIKTATFTAANGEGYFANTSGGAFTMNLPAGSAGAIVSVVDYTNTFSSNSLTVSPNGSEKIGGIAADAILGTDGQSVTFVYVDSTEGWKNIQDSTSNVIGNEFIVATGGTITTSGNCKIHTFTGPGTFTVSQVHPSAANNQVSYMVVAGGGGGGGRHGGGGGAGGFREDKSPVTPYTASPLDGAGNISVTATAFPITVGAGGSAGIGTSSPASPPSGTAGTNGVNSVFSTIISAGGGAGHTYNVNAGAAGGSGGAGGHPQACFMPGGAGNTPPVSPPQGNAGGAGGQTSGPAGPHGGGGGGATAAGATGACAGAPGGAGATTEINGSSTAFSGGGGGGKYSNPGSSPGSGGAGGGGAGGGGPDSSPVAATAGTANTGGGGGGFGGRNPGNVNCIGANGGSGVVIIRYKFQ